MNTLSTGKKIRIKKKYKQKAIAADAAKNYWADGYIIVCQEIDPALNTTQNQ